MDNSVRFPLIKYSTSPEQRPLKSSEGRRGGSFLGLSRKEKEDSPPLNRDRIKKANSLGDEEDKGSGISGASKKEIFAKLQRLNRFSLMQQKESSREFETVITSLKNNSALTDEEKQILTDYFSTDTADLSSGLKYFFDLFIDNRELDPKIISLNLDEKSGAIFLKAFENYVKDKLEKLKESVNEIEEKQKWIKFLKKNQNQTIINVYGIHYPELVASLFGSLLAHNPREHSQFFGLLEAPVLKEIFRLSSEKLPLVLKRLLKEVSESNLLSLSDVTQEFLNIFFITPDSKHTPDYRDQIERNIEAVRTFIKDNSITSDHPIRLALSKSVNEQIKQRDVLELQIEEIIQAASKSSKAISKENTSHLKNYFSQVNIELGITALFRAYSIAKLTEGVVSEEIIYDIISSFYPVSNPNFQQLFLMKLKDTEALTLVQFMIEKEIQAARSETLLRGNTVATSFVSAFHNQLLIESSFKKYFKQVWSMFLSDQSYELLSDKSYKPENFVLDQQALIKEQEMLLDDLYKILEEVLKVIQYQEFPEQIKALTKKVHEIVFKKFGEIQAKIIAPQCFFLRFLNPILSDSKKFTKLLNKELKPQEEENIKILSKCLQMLVNRSSARKEERFQFLADAFTPKDNRYIQKLEEIIETFIK